MHATAILAPGELRSSWRRNRHLTLEFFAWCLVAFALLFLSMDLRIGVYDEGFLLTTAMRELAGQIPHRDFYFAYGPAQTYLLALLFKLFGPSVLASRLLDLFFKSLLVATFQHILRGLCRPWIANAATTLLLLLILGVNMPGSVGVPAALLTLWATWGLLPGLNPSARRLNPPNSVQTLYLPGLLTGLATLFRYDLGVAVACVHLLLLAGPAIQSPRPRGFKRYFASAAIYLAGFLTLVLPVTIAFLAVAPFRDFSFDIFYFPAHFYRAGRDLPLPGIHLKSLDDLAVYLPVLILAAAVATLALDWRSRRRSPRPTSQPRRWLVFLTAFTLFTLPMFAKGLVRVSVVQMFLALVPAFLLLAVLMEHRRALQPIVRGAVFCAVAGACVCDTWAILHKLKDLQASHASVLETLGKRTQSRVPQNPLTRGLTFLPGADHDRAIEFLAANTAPRDTLYLGVTHHDRIFANDNLTYFATDRLPATKWSEFDPGLQNQLAIQQQMVADLQANRPTFIALDAEFDQVREPNSSSISSGVFLLDTYLAVHYRPIRSWGNISVWQRIPPPNPPA